MKKEMYKPKYERDSYFVPSDVTWSLVAIYFIDHGMTDTVAKRLAEAIGKTTDAVTSADDYNLEKIAELNPQALLDARFYHEVYGESGYAYEVVLNLMEEIAIKERDSK
tara:strand:+ start:622 stop:948 length:327 start_codon:yes stop_codon:yes gene_type:complete